MSFIKETKSALADCKQDSVNYCILTYLLKNAVGRANAKPWHQIEAHIQAAGFSLTKEAFQQGILKKSRKGRFYIGSTDAQPRAGFFLIESREDADVMSDFIIRRLSVEHDRLQKLRNLTNEFFPI